MPKRALKEEITTSERLASVSFQAESLWYRLLVCADDFGRFDARPIIVRSRAMPLRDVCLTDVGQWLDELRNADLIAVYEFDGKPYLKIQRWEQRTRANASKYPDESGTYEKNVGQSSDKCQTNVSQTVPEERGTRSEERGAGERKNASANRGTRLPADWKPSDAETEWAKQERPSIDVQLEAAKFADYWHGIAGAKGVKLDWSGTWRNWIRRADSPKNPVAPMTGTPRKRRELGT